MDSMENRLIDSLKEIEKKLRIPQIGQKKVNVRRSSFGVEKTEESNLML